jgi:hypothetical protein
MAKHTEQLQGGEDELLSAMKASAALALVDEADRDQLGVAETDVCASPRRACAPSHPQVFSS